MTKTGRVNKVACETDVVRVEQKKQYHLANKDLFTIIREENVLSENHLWNIGVNVTLTGEQLLRISEGNR